MDSKTNATTSRRTVPMGSIENSAATPTIQPLEIKVEGKRDSSESRSVRGLVEIHLVNRDKREPHTIEIVDVAYKNKPQRMTLRPGEEKLLSHRRPGKLRLVRLYFARRRTRFVRPKVRWPSGNGRGRVQRPGYGAGVHLTTTCLFAPSAVIMNHVSRRVAAQWTASFDDDRRRPRQSREVRAGHSRRPRRTA